MQNSRLGKFLELVLDNLFDFATIVIAAYVVIRHQVQPFAAADITELASWILAVLGLIAVSGIWDRNRRMHRIENLSKETKTLGVNYQLIRSAKARGNRSSCMFSQIQKLCSAIFATR